MCLFFLLLHDSARSEDVKWPHFAHLYAASLQLAAVGQFDSHDFIQSHEELREVSPFPFLEGRKRSLSLLSCNICECHETLNGLSLGMNGGVSTKR